MRSIGFGRCGQFVNQLVIVSQDKVQVWIRDGDARKLLGDVTEFCRRLLQKSSAAREC